MNAADTNIHAETITYSANGTNLQGYLAYDDTSGGPRPGVLVVHEWWGLNDYIRGRARMLAELGYAALAVDMFGDGKTADNPDDAGRLMNSVLEDLPTAEARFQAGHEVLSKHASTDGSRIAAIGYCFGGAVVLHAARTGMDLTGVVSFHGALGSFHKPAPGSVKAKVLVCHGADDQFISAEEVSSFKREMEEAGVDCRFVSYAGALHAFTNPAADENGRKYGLPLAYNADADHRSWQEMEGFFQEIFS